MFSIYKTMSIMPNVRPVIVQFFASIIGIIFAFIISFIDYRELCERWRWHAAITYALMLLTMIIGYGPEGTNNKAWIKLPFGLSLQSSELLKISTILVLAYFFEKYKNNMDEVKVLVKLVGIACVPMVAVALQKDSGTLLIYGIMIACMFFVAGISKKIIYAALGAGVVLSPVMWFYVLGDYQKKRIIGLFKPEEYASIMWQQTMGRISIGSGQIFGKGFLSDNHNAIPLVYNDFIFSFIAESIGFVGTILLLLLIISMWFKILSIARRAVDAQGTYICVGVCAMLMAQTFINIGMNLFILPVIGVTLPLLTAGGTSVVAVYCSVGLVLSVARHNKKNLF